MDSGGFLEKKGQGELVTQLRIPAISIHSVESAHVCDLRDRLRVFKSFSGSRYPHPPMLREFKVHGFRRVVSPHMYGYHM